MPSHVPLYIRCCIDTEIHIFYPSTPLSKANDTKDCSDNGSRCLPIDDSLVLSAIGNEQENYSVTGACSQLLLLLYQYRFMFQTSSTSYHLTITCPAHDNSQMYRQSAQEACSFTGSTARVRQLEDLHEVPKSLDWSSGGLEDCRSRADRSCTSELWEDLRTYTVDRF
jgi:hypothetical protein